MKNQQILVISDTLVEAIEHIKKLLAVKDYPSLYQMFTITIEGLQSIQPIIADRKKIQELSILAEIEKSIMLFAEYLENKNESQMRQVLQFSLEPKIKKLNELLKVQEEVRKEFVIGIYYDTANPIEAYDNDRLRAIMNEAKNQDCKVYLFSSEDVDRENEVIHARYSLEDEKKIKIPLPDVINNIFPNILFRQSEVEKWLRERIPFTTYPVGDKLRLPEKMLRETALGDLFIPFVGVIDMEKVYGFLRKYKKGVLKKTAAARGENIFFVEQRSKDRFVVEVNKKPIIMNTEGFERWITVFCK